MMRLLAVLILFVCSHSFPVGQKPILKLSSKTHESKLVRSMLVQAYTDAYLLNEKANENYITSFNSLALQYTGDNYCVDNAVIRYYVKSFAVEHKEYPASQCALNLNVRFESVILPEQDFHKTVHGTTDMLTDELETKAAKYILELPSFDFKFEQFEDLDYGLECDSGFQELMQVMYREKVLIVNLQLEVTVPEPCSFSKLNAEYDTLFNKSYQSVQIPMSGEFYCQLGTSVSCKMSMANTRNSRYRLFE